MGVEILVLSEDSGQGYATISALFRRVLFAYSYTGEQQVTIVPAEDRVVREATHANLRRSTSNRDYGKKVQLRRTIATKLAAGAVVAFHYDGDTAWSKRAEAETPAQFEVELRIPIRQLLSNCTLATEEKLMARLIEVTPHYSVEAWTYQADANAIDICRARYSGRDVGVFEKWAADRSALDEVARPKEWLRR